uniref:Uncharacterized protein n=2 Tax=Compsopogon caeruleus TaxID=31354 RepID=A0A7S1XF42_9RHOD
MAEEALGESDWEDFVEMRVEIRPQVQVRVVNDRDARHLIEALRLANVVSEHGTQVRVVRSMQRFSDALDATVAGLSHYWPMNRSEDFTMVLLNVVEEEPQVEYCYRFDAALPVSQSFVGAGRSAFVDLGARGCDPVYRWGHRGSRFIPTAKPGGVDVGVMAAWVSAAFETLLAPDLLFCHPSSWDLTKPWALERYSVSIELLSDHDKDPSLKLFNQTLLEHVAKVSAPFDIPVDITAGSVQNIRRSDMILGRAAASVGVAIEQAIRPPRDLEAAPVWKAIHDPNSTGVEELREQHLTKVPNPKSNTELVRIVVLFLSYATPTLLVDKVSRHAATSRGALVLVGAGNPSPFVQRGHPLLETQKTNPTRLIGAAISSALSGYMSCASGPSGTTAFLSGLHLAGGLGYSDVPPLVVQDVVKRIGVLRVVDLISRTLERVREALLGFAGGRELLEGAMEELDLAERDFAALVKRTLSNPHVPGNNQSSDCLGILLKEASRIEEFARAMIEEVNKANVIAQCAPGRILAPRGALPVRSTDVKLTLIFAFPLLTISALIGYGAALLWRKLHLSNRRRRYMAFLVRHQGKVTSSLV